MEIDYVDALSTAFDIYDKRRRGYKFNRSVAVRQLTAFDLFSPVEISRILDMSIESVKKLQGMQPVQTWPQRVWKPESLNALLAIAIDWKADQSVSEPLLQLVAEGGTSAKAISQLTGVPMEFVREAIYGHPNLLDLLRAGTDTPSD